MNFSKKKLLEIAISKMFFKKNMNDDLKVETTTSCYLTVMHPLRMQLKRE